jgi:uncharacterized membrane protein
MSTFVLVGIPVLVICGLAGMVVYERHTESAEARRRAEHLKRWLDSQSPPP